MKTVSYHHTPGEKPLEAKTLVQCLRENADKYPGKTALVFRKEGGERETVTFTEWRESMDKLGTAFIKLGMQCEDRIGVILPNCSDFPKIQFGLLQAGVVVVPMASTSTSADDLSDLIKRLDLKGLCLHVDECEDSRNILSSALSYVHGEEARLKGKLRFPIITVSDETFAGTIDFKSLFTTSDEDSVILRQRESEYDFESTALICLTSGSTGVPKGIELSHIYMVFVGSSFDDPDGKVYVDRPIVHLGGNFVVCTSACAGNTAGELACLHNFFVHRNVIEDDESSW